MKTISTPMLLPDKEHPDNELVLHHFTLNYDRLTLRRAIAEFERMYKKLGVTMTDDMRESITLAWSIANKS